ncbi:hypothetical protein LIA77_06342 [Sarocladium implicatum]|nr:hypothetical protein LIA77_06342 [Sarocladium implicatum]
MWPPVISQQWQEAREMWVNKTRGMSHKSAKADRIRRQRTYLGCLRDHELTEGRAVWLLQCSVDESCQRGEEQRGPPGMATEGSLEGPRARTNAGRGTEGRWSEIVVLQTAQTKSKSAAVSPVGGREVGAET